MLDKRHAFGCRGSLVVLTLLFLTGCNQILAERVVSAPNLKQNVDRGIDATPAHLKKLRVDAQYRIAVGPPNATVSVFVIEPSKAGEEIYAGKDGKVIIVPKPTTQPTTQQKRRGTVVLLHGILDQKEMLPYVLYREMLTHEGFRVVQVDLRGHGRSTGDWIGFGAFEARDMAQVLDALQENGAVDDPQVGVIGVSYGAGVAIQWAAIDPRVKCIVALEPFATLRGIAHDSAGVVLGPGKLMFSDADIDKTVDIAGKKAGFDPDDVSPLRAITEMKTPVLLIHSRTDELIPWSHTQRLHDAAPYHTRMILVDGPTHMNLWYNSFDLIRGTTLGWFKKHLTGEITGRSATTQSATTQNATTQIVQ